MNKIVAVILSLIMCISTVHVYGAESVSDNNSFSQNKRVDNSVSENNIDVSGIKVAGVKCYDNAKASGIDEYWKYWDQKMSGDDNVKLNGCRVVSFAKLLSDIGAIENVDEFDPDIFWEWAYSKNFFDSGCVENGVKTESGKSAVYYAQEIYGKNITREVQNLSLTSIEDINQKKEEILQKLEDGYYAIIGKVGSEEGTIPHYIYIDHDDSVENGNLWFDDSGFSSSYRALSHYELGADGSINNECVKNIKNMDRVIYFKRDGWEKEENTDKDETFNGHIYQIFTQKKKWNEARKYCESLGGHLLTITSKEEQDYIYKLIDKKGIGDEDIWIGATDEDNEGDWSEWITGEKIDYTNWGTNEPDNLYEDQDYAVICNGIRNGNTYHIEKGEWDDIRDGNRYFICEFENEVNTRVDYNGHRYAFYSGGIQWEEAKEKCEKLGGHLVTITDSDEQNFLISEMAKRNWEVYWIGLYKDAGQKKWVTGEQYSYTNIEKETGNNQTYFGMYGKDIEYNYNGDVYKLKCGQWYDHDNQIRNDLWDYTNTGYICEWEDDNPIEDENRVEGKFLFMRSDTKEDSSYDFCCDFGYFFNSSYKYQNNLTRMSMRVAMAAMDSDENSGTSNRGKYIKDLMDKLGFIYDDNDIAYTNPENPDADDEPEDNEKGNTIGTAIGSRTIKNGDETAALILVAVRGGGYLTEWAGNVNVADAKNDNTPINHYGFDIASEKVLDRIEDHIKKNNLTELENVKIWICGYSRAAAVSNLVAAKIDDGCLGGIKQENVFGFCFECPKNTQDRSFNEKKYNNIVNIVNLVDLVPLLAPNNKDGWEYYRYGKTYYIPDSDYERNNKELAKEVFVQYKNILKDNNSSYPEIERILTRSVFINYNNRKFVKNIAALLENPFAYMKINQGDLWDLMIAMFSRDDKNYAIDDILKALCKVILMNSSKHPMKTIGVIGGLGEVLENTKYAHFPEFHLMWIDLLEETDYLSEEELYYSEVILNCSVDVVVKDSSGNVVGKIIDDVPQDYESGIAVFVDDDGQKIIYVPTDDTYTVEALGTENTKVTVSNKKYDAENVYPTQLECYLDVAVNKGESMEIDIKKTGISVHGVDGSLLQPDITQTSDDLQIFSVNIEKNGDGDIEGGGFYTYGEYSKVTAIPKDGAAFNGWIIDGKTVSTELTYRFLVSKDTTITANFTSAAEKKKVYVAGQKVNIEELMGSKPEGKIKYNAPKGTAKVNKSGVVTLKKGTDFTLEAVDKKTKSSISSCEVWVEQPTMQKKVEVSLGESTVSLNAVDFISRGDKYTEQPVWISSKPSVASVDPTTGVITVNKKGTTKIYAVFGGTDIKDKMSTKRKYKTRLKVK